MMAVKSVKAVNLTSENFPRMKRCFHVVTGKNDKMNTIFQLDRTRGRQQSQDNFSKPLQLRLDQAKNLPGFTSKVDQSGE